MYKTKGKIETKEFLELSEVKVSDASSAKEEDKSASEPSNKTDKKPHRRPRSAEAHTRRPRPQENEPHRGERRHPLRARHGESRAPSGRGN